MKTSVVATLAIAAFVFTSTAALADPVDTPVHPAATRKVSQATGGHGTAAAIAASSAAEKMTIEKSNAASVFAKDDPKSKTLPGKNRHISGASGGHGSTFVAPAPPPAPEPVADSTKGKKK